MVRFKQKVVAVATAITMAGSLLCGVGNIFTPVTAEAATGKVVYEATDKVSKEVAFGEAEDWNNKYTVEYAFTNDTERTVDENFTVSAKVTVSADDYTAMSANDYIKFQGVVKLTDSWIYASGDTWPTVAKGDLVQDGDDYSATIAVEFKDKTAATLMQVAFELVGVGFTGTVNISNVTVANALKVYKTVVYEGTSSKATEVAFGEAEDWNNKKYTVEYASTNDIERSVAENFTVDAKVIISATDYANMSANDYIKFQGVVKLTDSWTYTSGDTWPTVAKGDLEQEGDNYSATITVEFKDKTVATLMQVAFELVGVGFAGTVNISDVVVTSITSEAPELEKMDPTVLSDLSSEENFNLWGTETGYSYYHGGTVNAEPVISYDSANERLKVSLDYSANSAHTWSEAKVVFAPAVSADVNNYNQISVDIIYPDSLDGTKIKFFSDGIINKDLAIDESTAEDLGNSMKKVTVTVGFTPSSTPFESVTIGIIGVSTSFKGDIYLDNLVLSQSDPSADFVEITVTPGTGTVADISKIPTEIKVTDPNMTDSAKALYAYLLGLANSDQVLFGHQNDVSRQVNAKAELGDVYDVTGSVTGVYGIDTLGLLGSEASGTDSESAFNNAVMYSKLAAENGAIVTLSTHMPNFTSSKIIKNEDGTYNFFQCDFTESKDLSNDSAKLILPGGEYNEVFNAYLDVIVDYAMALQEDDIPVIFRPLHENNGSWFWWGSTNAVETYKSLFRYTRDYLELKGVHNMLYVYSPNGPFAIEEEYLTRYPGDEYVDILAFDYYDDYNSGEAYDATFFDSLDKTCAVVASLATKSGKIAAISETGVRVAKADGSGNDGLLVKGNPVSKATSGTNWYQEISDIAKKYNMPYYLVWANFSDTNFYVPYKYNDTLGHEMINEFIEYYNDETSIFGNGTNFYNNFDTIVAGLTKSEVYDDAAGYMVYPFELDTILNPVILKAWVKNAEKVEFVLTNTATGKEIRIEGVSATSKARATSGVKEYTAEFTKDIMTQLGKTDVATVTLVADGVELAEIGNISVGKEKDKAPANVLENFDFYSGSNGLLDVTYAPNSAAGCSSEFVLDSTYKADGEYGGAFKYVLTTTGSEVWTGRVKSSLTNNDFSAYNAIQMWVKPDGMGQKLVVQLTDGSGEEFEVYLTDFVKGTEAQYVTIPFSSFKGKQGGTLDASNITKFAIWCNSVVPESHTGEWTVDSAIYFDRIEGVMLTAEQLAMVDANGLIITATSLVDKVDDKVEDEEKAPITADSVNAILVALFGVVAAVAFVTIRRKEELEER